MNESSIDALLTGLTSRSRKSRAGKTPNSREEEKKKNVRFCTIVDKVLLRKIRTIARQERVQIKDVVNAAFQKAVDNYEKNHGAITEVHETDITSLF